MRRLAITGAQGTGKSTMAQRAGEAARGLGIRAVVLEGIGAAVAAQGLPLGRQATAETFCAFAAAHLRRERLAEGELIVQDRCLLDLYAYCRVLGTAPYATEFVAEATRLSLSENVTVSYLPLVNTLPPSQSTVEDSRFRQAIAAEILVSAHALGIEVHVVDGTVDERVRRVLGILGITKQP